MYKKYSCSKCGKEWRSDLDSNFTHCIGCGLNPVFSKFVESIVNHVEKFEEDLKKEIIEEIKEIEKIEPLSVQSIEKKITRKRK